MVALLIGMFGIIVMMQLFSLSEGQKRATTGTGDAQSSGAIALFGLQRDIQLSGYGFGDIKLLGCNLTLPLVAAIAPSLGRAASTVNNIAAITINHASIPVGDANTDTLLVIFGSSNGPPQGDTILPPSPINQYTMQTPSAFTPNDAVIATPVTRATPCALSLTSVVSIVGQNVNVAAGVAGMATGTLFNLGQPPSLRIRAYAIRGGNLTVCDHMANDCFAAGNTANSAVWVPIANNVVSLRAEYGSDTTAPNMDGIVDVYNQTTPATYCGWARTPAIRLALVARSEQFEKTAVTTAAPTWTGTAAIVLTANTSWQNFRYKVFETSVPMRNIAWMGVITGC